MNRELVRNALRAPLLSMVVATTGAMSLSATAQGYVASAGTFDASVFAIGQEIQPSGFPQSAAGVITSFTDTTLKINGGRTIAGAAGARSLTVGLPSMRAWIPGFEEKIGVPFVEDEFAPTTRSRDTLSGPSEEDWTGFYYVRMYGVANGDDAAIDRFVNAALALYPIGRALSLTDGSVLRIRGYDVPRDVAPTASGILPYNTGWRVAPISIPWRVTTPAPL